MKFALAIVLLVCSCSQNSTSSARHQPPPPPDSPTVVVDGPNPLDPNWVSCWTSGNASDACQLSSSFCCFDEIDAPHYGWCVSWSANNCTRSWSYCDGNNDCAAGTMCTVHVQPSTAYPGNIFAIECRASLGSGDRQVCQPGDGTCAAGQSCVLGQSTEVGWYGLQPNIYVCYP